jgi:hypothetical protein
MQAGTRQLTRWVRGSGSRRAVMSADHEERLRRLALHDDHLIRSMLAVPPGHVEALGLDPKACALVRLGALLALDAGAPPTSGASSGPWLPARPPMRSWAP